MSGGVERMMEKWAEEDKQRQLQAANRLDKPEEVTYYCRVNGDKITWGYMKQIDDNLCIIYNKNNNTFNIIKL